MPYDTTFTPSALVTDMPVWGKYQRFLFNPNHDFVRFGPYSQFVPTSKVDSNINIDTRNYNYSGFRWNHRTKSTDTNGFGSFKFQSFIGENQGTDIFGYDGTNFSIYTPIDVHSNRIQNLSDPVLGTDAANKNFVLSVAGSGSVTLTGDVTGTGVTGTPFPTTITKTLNNIPLATGSVNINNQLVRNVSTPLLGTDAANKAYVDSFVPSGMVMLTGDVTGSGTLGTPFPTTLTTTLNNVPLATGSININNNLLNNVATPVSGTDGANKSYVDSKIPSGTITLTGNVTGSGSLGTPFPTTIVSKLNEIPVPTNTLDMNNQATIRSGSIMMGNSSSFGTSDIQIQFLNNALTNRKICLWQNAKNAYQFYGFGIQSNTLVYMVPENSSHIFYSATSSTSSKEVGRITGAGDYITSGTVYGLRPGISVYLDNNLSPTPISNPTDFFRIVGDHSTTIGPNQFTLTSSNPVRLTYSPNTGGNGNPPIKILIQANISFYYSVGNSLLRFRIVKNGTTNLPGSESRFTYGTSIYTAQAFFSSQVLMGSGDFIEFYVSGSPAPQNLTVQYGTFHITAV